MNFAGLFKAFNAAMALREVVKRFQAQGAPAEEPPPQPPGALQALGGQIEARLTNVVVAAWKEAFDRDHARLELERAQLEEERRRADATLRQELRRDAADRELARLRLLTGGALLGWIASVGMRAAGLVGGSTAARIGLAVGWVLLLGALGAAFTAQGRVGATVPDGDRTFETPAAAAALWLLLAGLAVSAFSLLL